MYSVRYLSLLVVAGLIHLAATNLTAQSSRELTFELGDVTISAHTIADLQFAGLEVAPDATARVFLLPNGGFGVSAGVFGGTLVFFDATGSFRATYNRIGAGPGEVRNHVFGVTVGDRLWIIDPLNGRLSIFSDDMALLNTRHLPGRIAAVARAFYDEAVFLSGLIPHEGGVVPVARISLNDEHDQFGGEIPNTTDPRARVQMAAETNINEVWTVSASGGLVTVLNSSDLSILYALRLPDETFVWDGAFDPLDPRSTLPAHVVGITADASGNLWLSVAVPDETKPLRDDMTAFEDEPFDTLVLLIDPKQSAIIAELRLNKLCLPVEGPLVSCVDEISENIQIIELRREH